jgi:peptidoglycan hydrolase-like amidase
MVKFNHMRRLATLILILTALLLPVNLIRACNTVEECQAQINQQNSQLSTIQQQQADLQKQLDAAKRNLNYTSTQLADLQRKVEAIRAQLAKVEEDLKNAKVVLDKNKELFRVRVRDLYIRGGISGLDLLFSDSYSFADAEQFGGLKQIVINRNRDLIIRYTSEVDDLAKTRDIIAAQNKIASDQLAQIQAIKNAQANQINSIQKNQASLSSQLAQINASIKDLTSRQQEIIAAKLLASQQSTTVGAEAPATTDLPAAPGSGYFAFLSYGYPHRLGMNQYGAYGRALSGTPGVADFQSILQAYYGMQATPANEPATIVVNGCNDYGQCFSNQTFDFEDYLKHLYEMPSSWSLEALKAQAVAARTYALRNGSPICPSQSCQEVKQEINASSWQQAVDATRGLVLGGNNPISAYYSSTDGGYTCTDWNHNGDLSPSSDTYCGKYLVDAVGGNWGSSTAYDGPKYGNSPWFHKSWGDINGLRDGKDCYAYGKPACNPWLSPDQTADLFNSLILYQQNSSYYTQFLSPPNQGGWSSQQVIDELGRLGISDIGSVTAIGIGFDGQGSTTSISAVGAKTSYLFSAPNGGSDFRKVFMLRSPGTLTLYWSSLYDVQKSP